MTGYDDEFNSLFIISSHHRKSELFEYIQFILYYGVSNLSAHFNLNYLEAQFYSAPQTYNSNNTLSIYLCTQLGTNSLHPIGYTFCVPNWVQILCTQLGTCSLHPIGCMNYLPNWVHRSIVSLSEEFALESPIWSIDCVPNWVH